MDIVARLFAPWRKPENKPPEMDEAAAEIERLREENKRLRQVTMACLGALAELSPCAQKSAASRKRRLWTWRCAWRKLS